MSDGQPQIVPPQPPSGPDVLINLLTRAAKATASGAGQATTGLFVPPGWLTYLGAGIHGAAGLTLFGMLAYAKLSGAELSPQEATAVSALAAYFLGQGYTNAGKRRAMDSQ